MGDGVLGCVSFMPIDEEDEMLILGQIEVWQRMSGLGGGLIYGKI